MVRILLRVLETRVCSHKYPDQGLQNTLLLKNLTIYTQSRGKTFNDYYDSCPLTTHRCCWWKHHLLRTLVPSTVQEADLQWDWYCTNINTSYKPNTKREVISKNAIDHPVLDLTSDAYQIYMAGTYLALMSNSVVCRINRKHLTLTGELASRLIVLKL